jgi:hypothetical protein
VSQLCAALKVGSRMQSHDPRGNVSG